MLNPRRWSLPSVSLSAALLCASVSLASAATPNAKPVRPASTVKRDAHGTRKVIDTAKLRHVPGALPTGQSGAPAGKAPPVGSWEHWLKSTLL